MIPTESDSQYPSHKFLLKAINSGCYKAATASKMNSGLMPSMLAALCRLMPGCFSGMF
jgi:hypothetical protein